MAFKLHGIKLPERKTTEGMPSVKMPAPETVTIPTAMHIGAPVKPVVKVGDEVFVGTLIAEDNEHLSAPVYSSVSGKVSKITEITISNGNVVQAIVIASDGQMTVDENIKKPEINSKEDLINECLMVYDDDIQSEIIVKILEKENNKNYTLKKFKNNLSNKLIRNGFSSSLVYKLIDRMQYDDNSELLIEKDFNKVYNRIKNKDKSENEKKQLIIQGLLSKGYEYSLIKKYLNESNFL